MEHQNLLGYTLEQMEQAIAQMGHKPYRAKQLFKWLYNNRQYDFELMTDFAKELRGELAQKFTFEGPPLETRLVSQDGTEKYLFRLSDGNPVETVLIPDGDRRTACVSSQSGCALACRFCATGTMGLLRNLTVGEILWQLIYLRQVHGDEAFSNVVFMGMGEPLQNYDNVIEAINIITHHLGFNFGAKRTTISTSGITPKIRKLADSGLKTRLALSLHAATQEKRVKIMPVAQTFGLEKLMEAIRYYTETTGERVMFEYILFDGFNDSRADIDALIKLVRGIPCKINILPYNPIPGLDFKRPSDERVDWFARELHKDTPAVTVRRSRGRDIDAACGQLAARRTTPSALSLG
ncbi:MAG: 23S rRNA (adenine(2503)-C(2))-methyltransferase RlmN [candidate division Zixibacteria bacterium]|nr:23S rRNA (adenine(2503)-C(2))-methyltransferase RlmN [candidate division Zixibacteria bacterium]